jgi:hypothetical protein
LGGWDYRFQVRRPKVQGQPVLNSKTLSQKKKKKNKGLGEEGKEGGRKEEKKEGREASKKGKREGRKKGRSGRGRHR